MASRPLQHGHSHSFSSPSVPAGSTASASAHSVTSAATDYRDATAPLTTVDASSDVVEPVSHHHHRSHSHGLQHHMESGTATGPAAASGPANSSSMTMSSSATSSSSMLSSVAGSGSGVASHAGVSASATSASGNNQAPRPPPVRRPLPRRQALIMQTAGIALIIFGCGINNWFLELIISPKRNPDADPAAGPLLTLLQFIGVAVAGFPTVVGLKGGRLSWTKPSIPWKHYAGLVAVFFAMSLLNNMAFAFRISQPMHMVIRSSSVVVTMVLGIAVFHQRYSMQQGLAALAVSLGSALATLAEANVATSCCEGSASQAQAAAAALGPNSATNSIAAEEVLQLAAAAEDTTEKLVVWIIGVVILLTVMILAAFLSQYQEWLYKRFGKHSDEMLFYMHLLSLPLFLVAAADLRHHAAMWSASEPTTVALQRLFGITGLPATFSFLEHIPIMWMHVFGNIVSQILCVKGVYLLAAASGALTVTFALTVRKFLSLVLSIWYFGNVFTMNHWAGAVLVLAGTVAYSLVPAPVVKAREE